MMRVIGVRSAAIREGRDTFQAVREYLEGLDDATLEAILIQFESRKTQRPKKRENKVKLIVARTCQGDAFLTR